MSIVNFLWRRGAPISRTGSRAAWQVRVLAAAGVLTAGLLAACSQGGGPPGASSAASSATSSTNSATGSAFPGLRGVVHGGQAPIVSADVTLYSAGQPNSEPAITLGNSVTDQNGNFLIQGFTCPPANPLIYVVVAGGNAGGGVNPAIKLMAALGPCTRAPGFVVVNELTTVAAVYALNRFSRVGASSAGLGGCADCVPGTDYDMTQLHGNSPALNNAFATAALLADVTTGLPATWLPSSSSCSSGHAPVNCSALAKLTGIANIAAACVNSAGSSSTECSLVLNCSVPGGTLEITQQGGTRIYSCGAPASGGSADTLAALLSIAQNAGILNNAGLFRASPPKILFSPGLGSPPSAILPTDWTIALNFASGALAGVDGIAIDGGGNVWLANFGNSSVTELSAIGLPVAGSPFTGGGLSNPTGIAIDIDGNAWIANQGGGGSVTELSASSGTPVSGSPFVGGGLSSPTGIAVDAAGNVWVANQGANSLTELNGAGIVLSGPSGLTGAGLLHPWGVAISPNGNIWSVDVNGTITGFTAADVSLVPIPGSPFAGVSGVSGIAIDASGDVWVPNNGSNSVMELTAAGTTAGASPFSVGGLLGPEGVAIDGAGNAWVANSGTLSNIGSSVTELSPGGAALSPDGGLTVCTTFSCTTLTGGFTGGGLDLPQQIAIDQAGDVWVTNGLSNSVTEIVGAAVPVVTPLVAQIIKPAATLVSIAVTPASATLQAGQAQQFTVAGTYADGSQGVLTASATWVSSNTGAATITTPPVAAPGGLVNGLAAGVTTITATVVQNGQTFTASASVTVTPPPVTLVSIAVTPANPTIAVNATQQFQATGSYSNGTSQTLAAATWTASGTAATVSGAGLATGAAPGTSTITASVGSLSGSTQLTVSATSMPLSCYSAPNGKGGGANGWDNQSYCASIAPSSTDIGYNYAGILTFTTDINGNIINCQYATSGTTDSGAPATTGPTACVGVGPVVANADGSGTFVLNDAQGEAGSDTVFNGSFPPPVSNPNAINVNGTFATDALGNEGVSFNTTFSGTQQ